MNLNEFSYLRGKHSLFSPSQPSFFNYSPEEFYSRLMGKYRQALGTSIHEYAFISIKRFHKVTSIKELIKDLDSFIFDKWYDSVKDRLSKDGERELSCLKYVSGTNPEVFETVKSYINDAIGFKMEPEVVVRYTDDFMGTADSLIFSNNNLRIHDLKTGSGVTHMEQLFGYAALFCLEQHVHPERIGTELRIYQNNDIFVASPAPEEIKMYMEKYRTVNNIIQSVEGGE